MKFRFCGELDVPDFLLAEVSILSKLSSVRLKLVCLQVVNSVVGSEIDFNKIAKLTKDAQLGDGDIKATIQSLRFIFTNAAKYLTDPVVLVEELAMLGLPKEHCEAIGRTFRDQRERIREALAKESFTLPTVEEIAWRIDCVLNSDKCKDINGISVQMMLDTSESQESFEMSAKKFRVLYAELKNARKVIEDV